MSKNTGLGRGLSSLIPKKDEEIISEPERSDSPSGAVLEVPIGRVHRNPHQPRLNFRSEDLADLTSSIKQHGILQPLVVTIREDGEYELIAGERRLRASKEVGLKRVPIVIRTATDQEKLELALIENIQRQDLDPIEEARAYQVLTEDFGLTQEQVSAQVGKSRSAVANTIRLLDLPDEIKTALQEGQISRSHARTLLSEPDQAKRQALFKSILGGGVTVREVEAKADAKRRGKDPGQDPNIADHEKKLQEQLGTKVAIVENNGRGKIIIEFYSRTDLKKLLDKLSD